MSGNSEGFLVVGCNLLGQVVINHPKIQQNERGGHIEFTPQQARYLARLLMKKADEAERSPRATLKPRKKHVDMDKFRSEMLSGGSR